MLSRAAFRSCFSEARPYYLNTERPASRPQSLSCIHDGDI